METDPLAPYKTDHLFLLVGKNPLPNYVAARLLAKPDAHYYPVCTHDTGPVCERLRAVLKVLEPTYWTKICVDEVDSYDVYSKVHELATKVKNHAAGRPSIGLHYTGGTKAMVAHAYQAIRAADGDAICTYLHAGTLGLIVDRREARSLVVPVSTRVKVSLRDLAGMHGMSVVEEELRKEAVQPDLCLALAKVHLRKEGVTAWQKWVGRLDEANEANLQCLWSEPHLQPVAEAMREISGDLPLDASKIARALGYRSFRSCHEWLKGKWLEHHTLHALQQVARERADIHEYGMNLKLKGDVPDFNLDVAAMRGYQLFALSCIASYVKDKCKEHLIEVYVRARQMGGDEARLGLVCAYRNPGELLAEVERSWDAKGKLRVFGAADLLDLRQCLHSWFDSQP